MRFDPQAERLGEGGGKEDRTVRVKDRLEMVGNDAGGSLDGTTGLSIPEVWIHVVNTIHPLALLPVRRVIATGSEPITWPINDPGWE